jgi:Protein of unknown function (DUF2442)
MSKKITITAVEALEGYRIRATFFDGAVKEIDLGSMIGNARGVFRALGDPKTFRQVRVNPKTGTVEWPGDLDLDPEVLYGRYEPASGARIERRTIREPASTAG